MSQDEFRDMLPGHADFQLPEALPPKKMNGRRPIPEKPAEQVAKLESTAEPEESTPEPTAVDVWDRRVADGLAFLRRRLAGAYEVDEFGFDPELTEAVFHPLLRVLYRDWFRTEVFGIENVPDEGPGLV